MPFGSALVSKERCKHISIIKMKSLIILSLALLAGAPHLNALPVAALEPDSLSIETLSAFNKSNPLLALEASNLDLIQRSKLALYELASHEVLTNTYVFKVDGSVEYMGNRLAASGQTILFQQDYVSYKTVEGKKVGILLRLEAELITKRADLNLNGIFAIGAAASSGSASGKLRLKVYGLSGRAIMDAIPTPSDISEQSLLNAFTAIATIKSKIYEDDVFVLPQQIPDLPFELGKRE